MNLLNNLSVRVKIITGFLIVVLISTAMGIYAIYDLKTIEKADTVLYEEMTVPLSEMAQISIEFQMSRVHTRDIILAQTPAEINAVAEDIQKRRDNVSRLSASFEQKNISGDLKKEYGNFLNHRSIYGAELDKLIAYAKDNRDAEAFAMISDNGSLDMAAKAEQESIDKILAMTVDGAGDKYTENRDIAAGTSKMLLIAIALVIALSILIGLYISSAVTKPLRKTVGMLREMSRGHLGERLNMTSRDEFGQMARTMDQFADVLQQNIVGSIGRISNGDVSAPIAVQDEKDEIAPAVNKTIETINGINTEIKSLIKSVSEGKLDIRGKSEQYTGSWKELIDELNHLIDAFVNPIYLTAEYIDRISKGDIPPKITDTYYGDFNEIKDNFNNCIDTMHQLQQQTDNLVKSVRHGNLEHRAEAESFSGNWAELISGFNKTVSLLVEYIDNMPSPVMILNKDFTIQYLNKSGATLTGLQQETAVGKKCYEQFKTPHCETKDCACFRAMNEGQKIESKTSAHPSGLNLEISYAGIPIRDDNDEVIGAMEFIVDQTEITNAIRKAEKQADYQELQVEKLNVNLGKLANGNLDIASSVDGYDEDTETIGKNFETINDNLNQSIEAIRSLTADVNDMTTAAIEGALSNRADTAKHSGEYAKIMEGFNNTLDAIIAPVQEASSVLADMSRGNLHVRVTGDYKGDHADLKNALNETIDNLQNYIGEISHVLSQIGAGNLDLVIDAEYRGDFSEIKDSLNNILVSLNDIMSELNDASEQVSYGSRQVSEGSQSLSQGSTEQAASIEELTASIEEIAKQTKHNAISANQASDLAVKAKESAAQGNHKMKLMLDSMSEINQSSSDISRIIKVIDDIAFQTNILALNAAVEAARAGQHGKGFAVVAEEVRSLAARSSQAANETTTLIENSILKVREGTEIANQTAEALDEIVSDIDQTASLTGEIAVSSNEQASGIAQVNIGIEQVSQVVQNNSATAEESAAASEELSGQAELLQEMVGKFRLKTGTVQLPEQRLSLVSGSEKY